MCIRDRAGDEADAADGATSRAAAAAGLAVLAEDGVTVADPRRWWGLLPLSTEAALVDPEREVVALSPSRVETALRNPLNWVLYHVGANAGGTLAQSVGTLVHSVAEHHPEGVPEDVRAELERRLPELGLPEGWITEIEHDRARGCLLYTSPSPRDRG